MKREQMIFYRAKGNPFRMGQVNVRGRSGRTRVSCFLLFRALFLGGTTEERNVDTGHSVDFVKVDAKSVTLFTYTGVDA